MLTHLKYICDDEEEEDADDNDDDYDGGDSYDYDGDWATFSLLVCLSWRHIVTIIWIM